jgi:hypothetical protein
VKTLNQNGGATSAAADEIFRLIEAETAEQSLLYFDAGPAEVWICNRDGSFAFFSGPDHQIPRSSICQLFPEGFTYERCRS